MTSSTARGLSLLLFLPVCAQGCSAEKAATEADAGVAVDMRVDRALPDAGGGDSGRVEGGTRDAEAGPIQLPRDEAPHTDPVEWWYYTGVLDTTDQTSYGFELVVFQVYVVGVPAYMAHFAVTDTKKKVFALDAKIGVGPQTAPKAGFDLKVGPWRMSGHAGKDLVLASLSQYVVDLTLVSKTPVVLQYKNGVLDFFGGKPFYYYSYPRMAASGTLKVDGTSLPVTGTVWMDHQWGDLGSGYDGWDWYSLRMTDSTEVMLFVVRLKSAKNIRGGTVIDSAGAATALLDGDFTLQSTGQWTSPHTQATYPLGWQVKVPTLHLDLSVQPVIDDQEFYLSLFGSSVYWEGLCDVSGTKKSQAIKGDAYVELTGY